MLPCNVHGYLAANGSGSKADGRIKVCGAIHRDTRGIFYAGWSLRSRPLFIEHGKSSSDIIVRSVEKARSHEDFGRVRDRQGQQRAEVQQLSQLR